MAMTLNPDKEHVKKVLEGLKLTGGYCPCSLIQNEDTRCKCKACREEEKCECNLFIKTE